MTLLENLFFRGGLSSYYFCLGLNEMVYALDSTSIRICLELSLWAEFHHGEGCVKMHTLIVSTQLLPRHFA